MLQAPEDLAQAGLGTHQRPAGCGQLLLHRRRNIPEMGGGGLHPVGGTSHELLEAVVQVVGQSPPFLPGSPELDLRVPVFAHHLFEQQGLTRAATSWCLFQ